MKNQMIELIISFSHKGHMSKILTKSKPLLTYFVVETFLATANQKKACTLGGTIPSQTCAPAG